jgi:uncharacterized membrane protein
VTAIREEVHIHAEAPAVYRRLTALESLGEWLPECFRDVRAEGERCAFTLALPLRTEVARLRIARLRIASAREPYALTLATDTAIVRAALAGANGSGVPAIESLHWELQPEGRGEVHVTLATGYRAPGGIAGPLLDLLIYRPHRRQALRDALWRLKYLVEGRPPP